MSLLSIAQRIHTQPPPNSVATVVKQLEEIALSAGFDVATVGLMRDTIYQKLDEYSEVLLLAPERILQSFEDIRGHESPVQFYSDQRLPEIYDAYTWPTSAQFRDSLNTEGRSPTYVCPKCNQESGHESECTAQIITKDNVSENCGWKLNPTSDMLRNSIKILIQAEFLNNLQIHHMFRPKGFNPPARLGYEEFEEDLENSEF